MRFVREWWIQVVFLSFLSFLFRHSFSSDHFILQHCKSQNKTNLECYYMPWSKCTLKDALTSAAGEFISYEKQPTFKNHNFYNFEETIISRAAGEKK